MYRPERIAALWRMLRALLHCRRGDLGAADAHLGAALEGFASGGDAGWRAWVCTGRSVVAHLERGLSLGRAADDLEIQAACLNNLALVEGARGRPRRGTELARAALELCERLGDRHRAAAVLNNLADLHRAAGEHDPAMDHLVRSVRLFAGVEAGDRLRPAIWKLTDW